MMHLLINGILVEIIIAPFKENEGWILIAIIKEKSQKAETLHVEIAEKIRRTYDAVMDNSPYMEEGQVGKIILSVGPTNGEPEVRLLCCEPLYFIDMLRMQGFSVIQKVIIQKS